MSKTYYEQQDIKNTKIIRELLKELPTFLNEFFKGISNHTSSNTRTQYAYDLRTFFLYLLNNTEAFKNINNCSEFTISNLEEVTVDHIEDFMEYIIYYEKDYEKDMGTYKRTYQNHENGKARKLSAIRTMFTYFLKKRKILNNPSELIDPPKIREKAITRLATNEMSQLLNEVDSGSKLTSRQKSYHDSTKKRDLAIIALLLGTGIRLSECVGIDIKHIDFQVNGIKITRKGGNEVIIYFGEEVCDALMSYMEQREKMHPKKGHENALFLSIQNRRLTDRAIQNLVKKYSKLVTSLKNISPHKLRSTYGTNLYRETGDIYLVATVLGHKDVNTTRKHYAQMDEDRRKLAASVIKLKAT